MRIFLLVLALMMPAVMAESVMVGSYNVSFNMIRPHEIGVVWDYME